MRLFEKQSGKIGIGKLALVLKYLFFLKQLCCLQHIVVN